MRNKNGERPNAGTLQPSCTQNRWRSLKYYDNGWNYFTLDGQKREVLNAAGKHILDWCKGSYRPYRPMPKIREVRDCATQTTMQATASPAAPKLSSPPVGLNRSSTTPEKSVDSTSLSETSEESQQSNTQQAENSYSFPVMAVVDKQIKLAVVNQVGRAVEQAMRQSEESKKSEQLARRVRPRADRGRDKRRRIKYKHRHAKTKCEHDIDRVIRNKFDVYVFDTKLRPRSGFRGRKSVHALKQAEQKPDNMDFKPAPPATNTKSSHVHTGLTAWQVKEMLYKRRCSTPCPPLEEKIQNVKSQLFRLKREGRFLARQGSDLEYGSLGGSSAESSVVSDELLSPKSSR
ncbi:MAG: hypothetical protein P1U40_13555 [Coxiellaceae bacterium]|nr:hypothetical protein [Coxiellaceae bacterium]